MPARADDDIRARCFHPTGSFIEFSRDEIEQSIPQRFEKIASRFGERLAVKSQKHRLTYQDLNRAANAIAHRVIASCGNNKRSVAVLMEHDAPVISAIMGALKAGKLYAPLDPSLPHDRSRFILEDVAADCILSNTAHLPLAKSLAPPSVEVFNVDDMNDLTDVNPAVEVDPDDLCWVIYTSGSTGKPKGVMQKHRNVLHFMMNYTNGLHICAEDRLTLLYSFSVNGGAHDIFAALCNGAGVFPWDLRGQGFAALEHWLKSEEITIYHSVPTAFRHFAGTLTGREVFQSIRIVRLGGEPVYKNDMSLFKRHFSKDCILVNRLGSSETGSLRMYFLDQETETEGRLVPVGYAVEDNEVILMDDFGVEVAGNEGEIAVKTRYVSPGYWRRPDLTAAAFLPDPTNQEQRIYRTGDLGRMLPDGCLLHLGRRDIFVKIRGYRVEPDEIEITLLDFPGIKEVAVTAVNNNSGHERLVAYVVPAARPGPNVSDMRRFLAKKLPDYMIPSVFMMLDALPLTDTLKVDRKALPMPNNLRPELSNRYAAPRTPVEMELAKIWGEALCLDEVGIHDDFFDLGGHSLVASRLVSRVLKHFQLEIPLESLFKSPTVAKMAKIIIENQGKELAKSDLQSILNELESLTDENARRLVGEIGPEAEKK